MSEKEKTKCYYIIDNLEIRLFDEEGNKNSLSNLDINIENEKIYEVLVEFLIDTKIRELKMKFPEFEFIDSDKF